MGLASGYCYEMTPGEGWALSSDEAWEIAVIEGGLDAHYLGQREIDGARCTVWAVAATDGERLADGGSWRVYAQTVLFAPRPEGYACACSVCNAERSGERVPDTFGEAMLRAALGDGAERTEMATIVDG